MEVNKPDIACDMPCWRAPGLYGSIIAIYFSVLPKHKSNRHGLWWICKNINLCEKCGIERKHVYICATTLSSFCPAEVYDDTMQYPINANI